MSRTTWFLVGAFLLTACAKDRSLDDFKRQQAYNNLAKLQAVEGRYSGTITDNASKRILGGFQLDLKARLVPDSNSGGSEPTGSPQLITELNFQDDRFVTLSSEKGVYDTERGIYEADFSITRPDKTVVHFMLNATINSAGFINGRFEGLGFGKHAASFSLSINGLDVETLAKERSPDFDKGEGKTFWYKAHLRMQGDPPRGRDVWLMAYYPVVSPNDHFIELFFPDTAKTLQLDWHLSDTTNIHFPAASWDSTTGFVVASGESSGGLDPWVPQFRCSKFNFSNQKLPFDCDYWSNRSNNIHMTYTKCANEFCR